MIITEKFSAKTNKEANTEKIIKNRSAFVFSNYIFVFIEFIKKIHTCGQVFLSGNPTQ